MEMLNGALRVSLRTHEWTPQLTYLHFPSDHSHLGLSLFLETRTTQTGKQTFLLPDYTLASCSKVTAFLYSFRKHLFS